MTTQRPSIFESLRRISISPVRPFVRRGTRGYTLLEQALATLVIGGFAAGAFTVGREVQATTAIHGANEAYLRCLATLECGGSGSDEILTGYEIYLKRRREDDGTFVPMYLYGGRERALTVPILRYDLFQRVLDRVHVDRREGMRIVTPVVQSAERPTHYRLKTRALPAAVGSDSFSGLTLTHPRDRSSRMPPEMTVDLSNVFLSTADPVARSASFMIPGGPSDGPCFHSRSLGTPVSPSIPDFASPCSFEDVRNASTHARIALVVRGSRISATPTARGNVALVLQSADGEENINLGGRIVDRNGAAEPAQVPMSFVPRGIPISQVFASDRDAYSEYRTYQNVVVRRGIKYRLRFELRTVAGALEWSGASALVFAEQFEAAQTTVACTDEVPPSKRLSKCALPHPDLPIDGPVAVTGTRTLDAAGTDAGCGRPSDLDAVNSETLDAVSARAGMVLAADDLAITTHADDRCRGIYDEQTSCPPVAVECAIDSRARITGCPEALAACPPPSGPPAIGTPEWSEREISLKPIKWSPATCADSDPTAESIATDAALPNLRVAGPVQAGARRFCEAGRSADDLHQDPRYACARFVIGERALPDDRTMLPSDSLFARSTVDLGCDWQRTVTQAARDELGVSAECEFSPERSPTAPVCLALPAERVPACSITLPCATTAAETRKKIAFTRDGNAPLPPECQTPGNVCERTPVFESVPPSRRVESREALARERAMAALEALYPGARLGCTESGCAQFDYTHDPASGMIATHATFRIPRIGSRTWTTVIESRLDRTLEHTISVR